MELSTWEKDIIILDHSTQWIPHDTMYYFAMDELLCKEAARSNASFCHIWRHPHGFVLGQRDYRLPQADEAMDWLSTLGYSPIVRNSGGAAVPLDSNVVNVSLVFPLSKGSTTFYEDFDRMAALITEVLADIGAQVQIGEIQGAYCPGDYDLSINGYKFCGIAQRRQLHAFCVQAFIVAGGAGRQHASLVRQFYDIAAVGAAAESYPLVSQSSTASLQELTTIGDNAAEAFIHAVKDKLLNHQVQSQSSLFESYDIIVPSVEQINQQSMLLKQRYLRA